MESVQLLSPALNSSKVVIYKTAPNVSANEAYDFTTSYMNCNDISNRDLQFRPGDQWLRGKCPDSFCPLGPGLATGIS